MHKYLLFSVIIGMAPLYGAYFYDLNKDGYLDIVISCTHGNYSNWDVPSYIYWGSPNGYSESNRTELFLWGTNYNSIADLNGDGWLDIVFSGRYATYIIFGKSSGYDTVGMQRLQTGYTVGNAITDLNGDGFLDIIVTEQDNGYCTIFWGSEYGYSDTVKTKLLANKARDVSVGDINGDGTIDLVVTQADYYKYAYIYYGEVTYSFPYRNYRRDSLPAYASCVKVADVNKDGFVDIVFSNHHTPGDPSTWDYSVNSYIYWGAASGFDTTVRTELPTYGTWDNAVYDLNGDGYNDLIFANLNYSAIGENSYIYWGSANGFSSNNRTELPTMGAHGIYVGDINYDGYVDIIFTNIYNSSGGYDAYSYIYWGSATGYSPSNRDSIFAWYGLSTEDNEIPKPSVSNLLRVRSVYGTPGCEVTLPVEMRNSQSVGGVQFVIKFDKNLLTLTPVPVNLGEYASNMELMYNIWDDSVKVCIYSTSGEVIESGEGVLAEVNFDINSSAQYGDSTFIDLMDVVVSDANANELTFEVEDGWIYFAEGMKGDVNKDGKVDILDVVRTINIILGIGEEPTEYELWAADVVPPPHGDGEVNVLDVVGIIAMILHEEIDLSTNEVTATVELGNPVGTGSELTVPVKLTNSGEIRGLQFTFVYDPDAVEIKDVLPKDRCTNFKVSYNTNDNKLTVLVYDEDGAVLNSGSGEILEIPVAIKGDLNGNPPLALESCVLATQDAREVNTTLLQKPTIVILGYPNPVKDNLMIDCYASGNLKKIAVYDMLGRMVRTLEPVKISHGLYRAEWDTKDNTGRKVRTGHYFIRGVMENYEGVNKVTIVR